MELKVDLPNSSYSIYIEENCLDTIGTHLDQNRKYAIVTDSGVPVQWVDIVEKQLANVFVITVPQSEKSKSFPVYESVLMQLADHHMSRKDAIIAVGGGVVGDLAGFCAATYMRGIDFYNIPTTVLSQVDSSVGGKTAIDLGHYKNLVGAFWQPKAVFISLNVLKTLDERQIRNGLVEALKIGLTNDPSLYEAFLKDDYENMDKMFIISHSIDAKRKVVEEDEKEMGLRKVLNFGHTIGHAIESSYGLDAYLHGECVGMGLLYFITDPILKEKVIAIEEKMGLPKVPDLDAKAVMDSLVHDKKGNQDGVDAVLVHAPGDFEIKHMRFEEIEKLLKGNVYEEQLWQ